MTKKIHLIGIGGIGMSALAQYYLSQGLIVSGSDLSESETINLLRKKKIKVMIGPHKESNLDLETNLVVYSPAVDNKNPELKKALKNEMEVKSYPQALGDLTKKYFTIAVSGTHGKSTTSSMISLILAENNLDPTVIIGTKLKEFNDSNFRAGKSKYLVIEADEYKRSFLHYKPDILIITNIEEDHLDYYQDIKDIMKAFKEYIKKIKKNGVLIINNDDKNARKITRESIKYSIKDTEKITLQVPGEHNLSNALAALTCARVLGIKDKDAIKTLSCFKGSWRRFEVFPLKNITLVSDYAHHPTEIEKTLKAALEKYPDKRIRCVFQPHQYERTMRLLDDFVRVFRQNEINEIIICDVYDVAGRESKQAKKKIDSQKMVKLINQRNVKYKKTLKQAENYIKKTFKKDEVLIVMGAGDIYNLFLDLRKFFDLTKKKKN